MKNKMTRDTVPSDFTLALVLVDAVPVLFFGGSMVLAGKLLGSSLFLAGALLSLYAGAAKVLWKLIVVTKKKNIWWMFLQMRIWMPVGFLLMAAGAVMSGAAWQSVLERAVKFPAAACFGAGFLGMGLMLICAFRLDSSDVRANWLEQIINGVSQGVIFLGLLLTALS